MNPASLRLAAVFVSTCGALASAALPLGAQQRDTMTLTVPAKGTLNFLAMGDWGHNGESPQREVAVQMGATAKAVSADFLLIVGDNFYPDGVRSVNDPQWRRSFEDVYTAYSLNVEWFVALGNHDYRGSPQAEIDYSRVSRRWRMPARYYAITKTLADGTAADFLIIDSNPFIDEYRKDPRKYPMAGTDTAKQRRWIDSTLKASKSKWKFIVGHHNVYSGGKRTVMPDMERLLLPLMKKYDVAAYICGHEHQIEHIAPSGERGVQYFISGGGGEANKNELPGTTGTHFVSRGPGFMTFSLARDSLLVQAVSEQGKLLYRTSVHR